MDGATALQEVFRRYLSAYGPATSRDFAQWFGIQPRDAADLPRRLADELEEVEVEGWRAWLPAGESEESWPEAHDEVRLLPHFDCKPSAAIPASGWSLLNGERAGWRKAPSDISRSSSSVAS